MVITGEVRIRAVRDAAADYEVLARLRTAIYPDAPVTAAEVRDEITRLDRSRFFAEWLIAEGPDGDPVGYAWFGHTRWAHHPHKYRMHVGVAPEFEGRGIGRGLMDHVLARLRARGAERVKASAREDRPRGIALLRRSGFVEQTRDFESRLPVAAVDLSRFPGHAERAARDGIMITTLAEEMTQDPQCLRAVYQLAGVLDMDTPRVDPDLPTPVTFAEFLEREVHHARALPEGFFLAKRGDLYTGVSHLKRSDADPGLLYQQLTGVLREYRGRGVAMALKLRTVEYAQRHGYREIRTWNSSLNAPMLAINTKLGFVRQPAWVEFIAHHPGRQA